MEVKISQDNNNLIENRNKVTQNRHPKKTLILTIKPAPTKPLPYPLIL
jgi:hypothetical protein